MSLRLLAPSITFLVNSDHFKDLNAFFVTQTPVDSLSYQNTIFQRIPKYRLKSYKVSYKMYVNVNRGSCLLRLHRYLILKSRVRSLRCCGVALSHGLVLHVGLTFLRCIPFLEKVLPAKNVSIIFANFYFVSRNHGLA